MKYESNIKEVQINLISKLSGRSVDDLLLEISQLVYASNLRRIHNLGKSVNGVRIGTYDPKYAKWRLKRGLEVGVVNLRVTGKLMSDWQLEKIKSGYGLGFVTNKSSVISRAQEEHFESIIWGVSKDDKENIQQIIKRYIDKLNAKA